MRPPVGQVDGVIPEVAQLSFRPGVAALVVRDPEQPAGEYVVEVRKAVIHIAYPLPLGILVASPLLSLQQLRKFLVEVFHPVILVEEMETPN